MTTATTWRGRTLPLNDWEGDDATPGAGGSYVTCMDTASGRMLAWATNGRELHDGREVRAHVSPPDHDGINFDQAAQAIHALCGRTLVHQSAWKHPQAWLRAGKGLVLIGNYSAIPRAYRWQASANFAHAMFVPYLSGPKALLYDPLDPQTHNRGRVVPTAILWPFLESLGWTAGYIPLEKL